MAEGVASSGFRSTKRRPMPCPFILIRQNGSHLDGGGDYINVHMFPSLMSQVLKSEDHSREVIRTVYTVH